MRIARWAIVHVLARKVVSVFAHVERADQHRAGRFQALDQGRVTRSLRVRAVDLGAGDRGEPCDIEQILDREGHTGERLFLAASIERARLGTGALGGHSGEGVEDRIELLNARERCIDHGSRRRLARIDRLRDLSAACQCGVESHRVRP